MELNNKQQWYILHEQENPTTDFFIIPWFLSQGLRYKIYTLNSDPPDVINEQVNVVIVRYLNSTWRTWFEKKAKQTRVYYFADDDLFDWRAISGMSWRYQLKIARLVWQHWPWLKANAKVLFSSAYLQQKYGSLAATLLSPSMPLGRECGVRIFYHGTASHKAEIAWIYELMSLLLPHQTHLNFEIIGDFTVNKLFRTLPRVHVIHPMRWSNYQALINHSGRHIGLAPLLDTSFNAARSATKFFDITRAGAVGIYSRGTVYESIVKHQHNGLLLANDINVWANTIISLSRQPSEMAAMQHAAMQVALNF